MVSACFQIRRDLKEGASGYRHKGPHAFRNKGSGPSKDSFLKCKENLTNVEILYTLRNQAKRLTRLYFFKHTAN